MNRRSFGAVRKLASGKYQARYVVAGERYSAPHTFTAKSHATTWLSKTETAISNGSWVSPSAPLPVSQTFSVYSAKWLSQRSLTPRTRAGYQRLLERFLWPEFGTSELTAISVQMVREWFSSLGPTPTQNAHAYSLLNTIMKTAVEDEIILASPCRVKNATRVKRAKDIKVLTAAQVKAMANLMPERFRVLLLLTAFCCLRFGEVTELRRKDFADGKLKVRRGVTWLKGGSVIGQPKTVAGVREVPVLPSLRPMLEAHMAAHSEPGENGLIFPGLRGGHLTHAALMAAFYPARLKMGRSDLTWHDLRHTGAVIWAADSEIRLKDLMGLLGHETPAMALHYQHVVEGKLDEVALRLDHHLSEDLVLVA